MQTFIPLVTPDYSDIAQVLDNKRLNKQALEAWQILMVLTKLDPAGQHREPKGWVNHPAVKMWQGHELHLAIYAKAMVDEWQKRGFNSTIGDKVKNTYTTALNLNKVNPNAMYQPDWLMSPIGYDIASTHRQALLVKNYEWYSQFKWPEDKGQAPTKYEYIWPVN